MGARLREKSKGENVKEKRKRKKKKRKSRKEGKEKRWLTTSRRRKTRKARNKHKGNCLPTMGCSKEAVAIEGHSPRLALAHTRFFFTAFSNAGRFVSDTTAKRKQNDSSTRRRTCPSQARSRRGDVDELRDFAITLRILKYARCV